MESLGDGFGMILGGFWEVKSTKEGRKGGKKGERREGEERRGERGENKRKKVGGGSGVGLSSLARGRV